MTIYEPTGTSGADRIREWIHPFVPLTGILVRPPEVRRIDGKETIVAVLSVGPKRRRRRREVIFPEPLTEKVRQLRPGQTVTVVGDIHILDRVNDAGAIRRRTRMYGHTLEPAWPKD
jgi:hypothetical protein